MMKNEFLSEQGLNLQTVIDLQSLPQDILDALQEVVDDLSPFRQLILLGNGGGAFWRALKRQTIDSANPVDDFSLRLVKAFLNNEHPTCQYQVLYPADWLAGMKVPLQKIGTIAGWHHSSLLKIGINAQWGLWFAYRALALTDMQLTTSERVTTQSPCETCASKHCIQACPASAISEQHDHNHYDHQRCINFRLEEESVCAETCLARLSCPVQAEHRYSDEQIHYHYARSLPHLSGT
jgi:epoxyqueuosine reductase